MTDEPRLMNNDGWLLFNVSPCCMYREQICHMVPAAAIDYRSDDEKKNSCVGATSWYHCVAEDSRIPKMPVINPLIQALVLFIRKLKKKLSCMDCQPLTPTSENSPFLVNKSAD
jgi:hypothetical protein